MSFVGEHNKHLIYYTYILLVSTAKQDSSCIFDWIQKLMYDTCIYRWETRSKIVLQDCAWCLKLAPTTAVKFADMQRWAPRATTLQKGIDFVMHLQCLNKNRWSRSIWNPRHLRRIWNVATSRSETLHGSRNCWRVQHPATIHPNVQFTCTVAYTTIQTVDDAAIEFDLIIGALLFTLINQ
jgi:hypothetical protein